MELGVSEEFAHKLATDRNMALSNRTKPLLLALNRFFLGRGKKIHTKNSSHVTKHCMRNL